MVFSGDEESGSGSGDPPDEDEFGAEYSHYYYSSIHSLHGRLHQRKWLSLSLTGYFKLQSPVVWSAQSELD